MLSIEMKKWKCLVTYGPYDMVGDLNHHFTLMILRVEICLSARARMRPPE